MILIDKIMKTLIIIDVQNEYSKNGGIVLPLYEEIVSRTVEYVKNNNYDKIVLIANEGTTFFRKGTWEREIDSRIKKLSNIEVVKNNADAFQDTNLEKLIEQKSEIHLAGMMTHNCVSYTAFTGKKLGFDVKIIENLCATRDDIMQQIAIRALKSKGHIFI